MVSTDRDQSYTIKLTNGSNVVEGIVCDGRGRPAPEAFQDTQFPRNSLKIQQGGTEHSDYDPPYRSIEQGDLVGGRGLDDIVKDTTRFFDSYRLNTWNSFSRVLKGPEEQYATGIRANEYSHWWDAADDRNKAEIIIPNDTASWERYYSYKFATTGSWTPTHIQLCHGLLSDSPFYVSWKASIYSDNAGEPGTELYETANQSYGTRPLEIETLALSEVGSPGTLNGTYHMVIKAWTITPDTDYTYGMYVVGDDQVAANTVYTKTDESSWAAPATEIGMYFRIFPTEDEFEVFFFEHLNALYAAVSYRDMYNAQPKIFMNGWRGKATSTTPTTLVDTGQAWTVDDLIGCIVILHSGHGSWAKKRWRVITDNDATSITVDDWEVEPEMGTRYAIVHHNTWTEVTGHGITGRITDVHVIDNIVYFMRGDNAPIFHMFDDTFAVEGSDNVGTFMMTAKASDTHVKKVYLASAGWPAKILSASPVWTFDGLDIPDLEFTTDVYAPVTVADWDAEGGVSNWTIYNGPGVTITQDASSYQGDHSVAVTTNAAGKGSEQQLTGLTASALYKISVYVRIAAASTNDVQINLGSNQAYLLTGTWGSKTKWVECVGFAVADTTSEYLRFLSYGGACDFFYDVVRVEKVADNLTEIGNERITNLIKYGPNQILHVITTGGIYREYGGDFLEVSPPELGNTKDDRNGAAALTHGPYLYLSLLDSLGRFYQGQEANLDILGPTDDEGLPENRRGNVADIVGYLDTLYLAIDGGSDNYSSILVYNGIGFHEIYRAPATGLRINGLYIQTLPGGYIDRLWFNEGSELAWVGIDLNPSANSNYRYTSVGTLDVGTIFSGMKDVEKYFNQVKVHWDGYHQIGVYHGIYNVAQDRHICPVDDGFLTSRPYDTASLDVAGYMLYIQFGLEHQDVSHSPEIFAFTVDVLEHLPVKRTYQWNMLISTMQEDLQGVEDWSTNVTGHKTALENMVNTAALTTVVSQYPWYDSVDVKMAQVDYRVVQVDPDVQEYALVAICTAIEA
jgi:hypothetical protein